MYSVYLLYSIVGTVSHMFWSSGKFGNVPNCSVRGLRFESHHRQLCLLQQPLWYRAFDIAAHRYCSALVDSAFHSL